MCTGYTPRGGVGVGGSKYPFPLYADLGKECRDLFTKGYILGQFKVNVKNQTCHGIEVVTTGVHNNEDKKAKGEVNLKANYPFILQGLQTTHKWNTDNLLKNEVILDDVLYPGMKLSSEFVFDGEKTTMSGGLKLVQKHQRFTLDALINSTDEQKVIIGGSLVTGHRGLMGAYQIEYDTDSGELKGNNMGAAYQWKDYKFFLSLKKLKVFEAFFHHKVSREVELGAMIKVGEDKDAKKEGGGEGGGEEAGGGGDSAGGPLLGIAGKYMFNSYGHALRARINNQSVLGLAIEMKIAPGWQTFASTEVDLKKFEDGNHKIGFGMDFGYE